MFHINDFLRSEIKKCLVFIFSLLCFFTFNSYAANQRLTQPELPDFSNFVTDNLQIATLKDSIIFFNNNGLWKSDGMAGGKVELIKKFDVNTHLMSQQTFKETPNFVYFSIGNSTGLAIWRTDGTLAGTVKAFDKALISYFTSTTIGDTLYFFPFTIDGNYELWKSEGTSETTQLVKQLSGSVQFLTAIGNTLYFSCANNGKEDLELWTSDGTALGTKLVKDINAGVASSYVQSITEFNGKAYFFADDGIHGLELWRSDGTEAGTNLVMDINKKADSSILSYIDKTVSIVDNPAPLKVSNNKLYFFADDGIHGYELWKSDGTEIGTSLVKDIVPGSASAFSYHNTTNPYSHAPILATLNGLLYFPAYNPANYNNTLDSSNNVSYLWKTDGTEQGTTLVNPNAKSIQTPLYLTTVQDKLLFFSDGTMLSTPAKSQFWYSDGSESGTQPLNEICANNCQNSGWLAFASKPIYIFKNKAYIFSNSPTVSYYNLWVYDPTDNSVKSLVTLPTNNPINKAALNINVLLQGAYDASTGLMRDDLRQQAYLPIESPYFAQTQVTEELNPALLARSDDTAPVDWVLIELRDKTDKTKVVATKSALIQRNGQVIDPQTGSQTLSWDTVAAGDYFVAIKHRNHLGIMSNNTVALGTSVVMLDFTNPLLATLGAYSRLIVGDKALMWAGDSNQDGMLIANGNNSDTTTILGNLLMDPLNTDFNSNYMLSGYFEDDINMDGSVSFAGPNNDITPLIANILVHPDNTETAGNYIVKAGF